MWAQRIQRRRVKGWRMPEGVITCTRGTRWGNPFRVTESMTPGMAVQAYTFWLMGDTALIRAANLPLPCKPAPSIVAIRNLLRGSDLACWCALDAMCHANILLRIANTEGACCYAEIIEYARCTHARAESGTADREPVPRPDVV